MRIRVQARFPHFLVLSLLIHSITMVSLVLSRSVEKPKIAETVQLEIVEAPAPVDDVKTVRSRKSVEIRKNQIVDQAEKALNDETPEDARFLSRHNQVVRKQTVAANRGEFKNKQSKETQQGDGGAAKSPSLIDLKPKFDVAKAVENRIAREQEFEKAVAEGHMPVRRADPPAAAKSLDQAGGAKSAGAETSQTLDYIKDLEPGMETLLSTKEFVYYSYFNRIRNQLNQYWTDKVRQKLSEMYKKGRMIASSDDKVTKCLITLDPSGKLLRIQIIGDSGVRELDEAAVEAFKAAAPFPNPPKGMIDPDGTIKIRWDFILEA